MKKKTISFKKYLIESLKDPKEASEYLNVALEEFEKDRDVRVFLLTLRDVVEAQGGFSELALKTKLNRQNLYRVLSKNGNPRISTLGDIINCLGFSFSIKAINKIG